MGLATSGKDVMSLSGRVLMLVLVPMLVLLTLYGTIAHQLRHKRYRERAANEVADMSALFRTILLTEVPEQEPARVQTLIDGLVQAKHVFGIAVFDEHKKPIALSAEIAPYAVEIAPIAARALSEHKESNMEWRFGSQPVLLRAIPVDGHGVALVGRDLSYIERDVREGDRMLGAVMTAILLVTAFPVILLVRRTIVAPTNALVVGVEQVAAGQLEARVPEEGAAELGRLAVAFNGMTASLVQARREANAQAQARASMERRVQHNQALAAAGQLAASVAHEIGSPLNIILGRARLSAEDPACPEPVREDLQTIADQCERISRVVQQLLDLVRVPSRVEGSESCAVAEVVNRVVDFVTPEGRMRGVAIEQSVDSEESRVALSEDRLFQVLFNLCMNAMQAQPDGGKVVVQVRDGRLPLSCEACKAIEVLDNGPGVPDALLEAVTKPFFTTKPAGEGTGLGLAIVDGIVRDAGGKLEVENIQDGGAKFRVILPVARPSSSSLQEATPSAGAVFMALALGGVRHLIGMATKREGEGPRSSALAMLRTRITTTSPADAALMACATSCARVTGLRSTSSMRSPGISLPSAGAPGMTAMTTAPRPSGAVRSCTPSRDCSARAEGFASAPC